MNTLKSRVKLSLDISTVKAWRQPTGRDQKLLGSQWQINLYQENLLELISEILNSFAMMVHYKESCFYAVKRWRLHHSNHYDQRLEIVQQEVVEKWFNTRNIFWNQNTKTDSRKWRIGVDENELTIS